MRTDRDVMYWTQIARGHCSQWFDFSKQWTAFGKVLNQTKHFLPAIDTCCHLRNSVNTKNMLWIHIQSGVMFWPRVITNGFPLTSELGRAFRSVPGWLDDSSLCRAVLSEAEYVPDPLPTTCPVASPQSLLPAGKHPTVAWEAAAGNHWSEVTSAGSWVSEVHLGLSVGFS